MLAAVVERIADRVSDTEPALSTFTEDVRLHVKLVDMKPPQPQKVDDWFVLLHVPRKVPGILFDLFTVCVHSMG